MHVNREQYHAFSTPLEGRVLSPYVDVKGLITVGVGNLIDPISLAESLPWTLEDGSRADVAQVRADWHKLKDASGHYSKLHWKYAAAATKIRLTDEAVDALVDRQIAANEAIIKKRFPAWDSFPSDAQLAIMSIAWAVGAGFWLPKPRGPGFINLAKCIDAQDWEGCVASCKIHEEGNPGVVPRNAKNRFCFHNAALVKAYGVDPSVLYWPGVMSGGDLSGAHAAKAEAEQAERDYQNLLAEIHGMSWERTQDALGTAAGNQREFDHDTDPSELAPESEPYA